MIREVLEDREIHPEHYTGDLTIDMQIAEIKNGVTTSRYIFIMFIGWLITLIGGAFMWVGIIIGLLATFSYILVYWYAIPKIKNAYEEDMKRNQ